MARNSEKAQSMLFRFRAQQAASLGILDLSRTRRPRAITTVTSIPICEKWRGQVLKEISRKVSKIQEASLSDFQIRDLNDEINKLMREKHMWEVQIRGLGGPNYMRGGGRVVDEEGREIEGAGRGYRYFGRARTLPGVAELFAAKSSTSASEKPLESRHDLRRNVDASYYGYNLDEEDGTLLAYEAQREAEAREEWLKKAREGAARGVGGAGGGGKSQGGGAANTKKRRKRPEDTSDDIQHEDDEAEDEEEEYEDEDSEEYTTTTNNGVPPNWEPLPGDIGDGIRWRLPTLEEVSEELVERRRRRLLETLG